mmetsp:Transcript_3945/g.10157  ORF Transcript_3945/g.10157 Transcript_3945/m.10157 type:complete len:326 (+) Transcript_3945:160-1137(+)|eukprot:jgi/Tetstr1/458391/TSEL_044829.t1
MAAAVAQGELAGVVKAVSKAAAAAGAGDGAERQRALDGLGRLAKWEVTLELLAATGAGKALKKLSKGGDKAVAEKAAEVVAAWKRRVATDATAAAGGSSKGGALSGGMTSPKPSASGGDAVKRTNSTLSTGANSGKAPAAAGGAGAGPPPTPRPVGDPVRDKGRALFAESLHRATAEGGNAGGFLVDVAELAEGIEAAMFSQFGGVTKEYKAKFRSLNFNLKDPKNPDLRGRLVRGEVAPADLVTLSSEELASRELQEKNEKIREWALFEAERGKHLQQASTDQFQCGKCKQRKTRYFQMQTRSADEPMTTFVTCVNCGNRWKFC